MILKLALMVTASIIFSPAVEDQIMTIQRKEDVASFPE